jgi:exonuclease III
MLNLISFNSCGFNFRQHIFLDELAESAKPDIFMIQEHHLLEGNTNTLRLDNGYTHFSSPAQKSHHLSGRPSSGCAILLKDEYVSFVSERFLDNPRFTALSLCNNSVLLISAYLPCDNYSPNIISDPFQAALDSICQLIISVQPDKCIIGGDFNVDFSRNNSHSNALRNALNDIDLTVVQNNMSTFERNGRVSQIDHFFVSPHITTVAFDVLNSPTNPSDHSPIFLSVDISLPTSRPLQEPSQSNYILTTDGLERLHDHCEQIFEDKTLPPCTNINCNRSDHLTEIEAAFVYCHDVILGGCSQFFRQTHNRAVSSWKNHWTQHHTSLRDSSLWWHWLWTSSNKPLIGLVYENMKSTRTAYHHAIKQLKSEHDHRRLRALERMKDDSRRFFKKVNEFRGGHHEPSVAINGKRGENAANEFVSDINTRSNPIPNPAEELLLMRRLSNLAENECNLLTYNDIAIAIEKLRPSKLDPNSISSTVVKHLGPNFIRFLTSLLNSLVIHGYNPECLSTSILTPLLKAHKRAVSDVSSYRLIASIPVFLKIFDYSILHKYNSTLHTNHRQFGYKKGHSPVLATLLVKETVNHYITKSSHVYGCFLDATKAFAFVDRVKLFNKLLDRNLPPVVVRFYYVLYSRQVNCIKWDRSFSILFILRMGVLQGSVASPVFFAIYIDDLHLVLERSGYGCWIGSVYLGLVAYADDHVLLMPSLRALEQTLSLILSSAASLNLVFNPSKSSLIKFTKQPFQPRSITLCGCNFEQVKRVEYLGNIIQHNLSDGDSLSRLRNNVFWKGNSIIQGLRFCHPHSIAKVFLSKCLDFYGSDCLFLKPNIFKRVETAFNTVVRKCFRLHYRSHVNVVCSLINVDRIQHVLLRRSISLIDRFKKCNSLTSYLYNFFLHDTHSYIGNNLWTARYLLLIAPPVVHSPYQPLINEVLNCLSSNLVVNGFSRNEMKLLLDYLTTC